MNENTPMDVLNNDMSVIDKISIDIDELIENRLELESEINSIMEKVNVRKAKLELINSELDKMKTVLVEIFTRRGMKSHGKFSLRERKVYKYNEDAIMNKYEDLKRVKVELNKESARRIIDKLYDEGLVEIEKAYSLTIKGDE